MPHAWKAGEQTVLLRRQLEAMADGGTVVISAPANPFRCPPGPYERASLIAYYLKTAKPRSKLIVLDAKDSFSKQRLFQAAWQQLYPGLIEWVSLSNGGKVTSVDPASRTLVTDFASYKADVANVIPPQRAGHIAEVAGVSDATGWCPIDPITFESRLQPGIHVIGDAAIAGAMPKSAFAANAQAKVCAAAVAALLNDEPPSPPKLINTCYSLVAPDYGISIAGVYHPVDGQLVDVQGAGGVSPSRCRARLPRPRGELCGGLVPHDHGPDLFLMRSSPPQPRCSCGASLPRLPNDEALQPYRVVGDAIPEPLTGASGDPVGRPGDRRGSPARRLSLVPHRPLCRGAVPGNIGARSVRGGVALVGRAVEAAAGRRDPSRTRHDHAALLPGRWPHPRRSLLAAAGRS